MTDLEALEDIAEQRKTATGGRVKGGVKSVRAFRRIGSMSIALHGWKGQLGGSKRVPSLPRLNCLETGE